MSVKQLLASPALQENDVLGIVNALEQLVLLAAILLLDDRPQGLESASGIVGPARSNLDRDDVPNGHTSLVERRAVAAGQRRVSESSAKARGAACDEPDPRALPVGGHAQTVGHADGRTLAPAPSVLARPPTSGTRISDLCGRVSPGRGGAPRGCDGVLVEPSSTDGLGGAGIGSTAGEREAGNAGELA